MLFEFHLHFILSNFYEVAIMCMLHDPGMLWNRWEFNFSFFLIYLFSLEANYNIVVVLSYIDMNQPWVYMCSPSWTPFPPPSPSHPSGSSQCTSPEHVSHASNLDWRSVSHMIIYMFQCYSVKSSHPHPLPQSPKDCSIHLCLFFCFAYRFIVIIFLNSIYMH